MITDSQAEQLAAAAMHDVFPNDVITTGEIACLFAVSLLESSFGYGWHGSGAGSYNQGAVQCGAGWTGDRFVYTDTHPNADGSSTSYSACFRKYATEQAGWDDLDRIMYTSVRASVRQLAAVDDWYGVSAALYATHYYEGFGATREDRIHNHDVAMRKGINRCLQVLQHPPVVVPDTHPIPVPETIQYGSVDSPGHTAVRLCQQSFGLACDGIFGHITDTAVRTYQDVQGLKVDGIVGPATWALLLAPDYQLLAA